MYLQGGIASSTHVDQHGQRVDRSLLEDMASQINAQYVPLLIDHDFNRQVGVVLSAKLAALADGEYGLLVISGIFENEEEAESFQISAPNTRWQDFERQLGEIEEQVTVLIPPGHADTTEDPEGLAGIAARLQTYLDSTEIMPDGSIYLVKRHIEGYSGTHDVMRSLSNHAACHHNKNGLFMKGFSYHTQSAEQAITCIISPGSTAKKSSTCASGSTPRNKRQEARIGRHVSGFSNRWWPR